MSKYEFLPGDKVLIKGREDSGEWIVVESHPRNATVTLAALGSRTVVDKTDLVRIPSATTAFEPCWFQVGDVTLYPECPHAKMATLQAEVALAIAQQKEKIAHLDDRIRHRDKLIDDQRRKIAHLDEENGRLKKHAEDLKEMNLRLWSMNDEKMVRISQLEVKNTELRSSFETVLSIIKEK